MASCDELLSNLIMVYLIHGRESQSYNEASRLFKLCMLEELSSGTSHAATWDERRYLLEKEIEAARDSLLASIKKPTDPSCGPRSAEIRALISGSRKAALTFSKKVDEAFSQCKIELAEDETYACLLCIVKKPEYASEALAIDPLEQQIHGKRQWSYIMNPAITEAVMDLLQSDRIKQ